MPVGMLMDNPEGTKEQYEAFNMKMFGTSQPSENIPGLIVHTAGPARGGWRIFDVWESREDFDRFMEEKVMPAAQELGMPTDQGPMPEIYELDNVFPAP